jgi:hypothetical protein
MLTSSGGANRSVGPDAIVTRKLSLAVSDLLPPRKLSASGAGDPAAARKLSSSGAPQAAGGRKQSMSGSGQLPTRSSSKALAKLGGSADRVIGDGTPRLDAEYLRGLDNMIQIVSSILKEAE